MKRITDSIARLFSTLALPPIVFIVVVLVTVYSEAQYSLKGITQFIIALIFGVILPVALFIYLMKMKNISDQDATMREQRDIPYRFAILFMSLGLGLATAFKCSKMIFSIWLIYLTVSLIIYFINKHWKISAHAMSFAAGSAILVQSLQLNPFAAVIMITLVVWSRIQLRVHTPIQLIAGTMVGAVISVVLRWLMING